MFGCPYAQESIKAILSKSMIAPYFPVDFSLLQAEIFSHEVCEETFDIGPIHITNIQLNHPNQGMGYKNRSLPCFAAQPGMEIIF